MCCRWQSTMYVPTAWPTRCHTRPMHNGWTRQTLVHLITTGTKGRTAFCETHISGSINTWNCTLGLLHTMTKWYSACTGKSPSILKNISVRGLTNWTPTKFGTWCVWGGGGEWNCAYIHEQHMGGPHVPFSLLSFLTKAAMWDEKGLPTMYSTSHLTLQHTTRSSSNITVRNSLAPCLLFAH